MRPDQPRPLTVGPDDGPEAPFPLRLDGKVIKGFGRGSSELGIPTANIPLSGLSIGGHSDLESGVYYGWAGLSPSPATLQPPQKPYDLLPASLHTPLLHQRPPSDTGSVYPMVMSIGWNPFYKNSVRSVEVHLMHAFPHQFYDSHMNLVVLGFIRPEYDYVSKESLIEDIRMDIEVAGRSLGREAYARFARKEEGLVVFGGKSEVAS